MSIYVAVRKRRRHTCRSDARSRNETNGNKLRVIRYAKSNRVRSIAFVIDERSREMRAVPGAGWLGGSDLTRAVCRSLIRFSGQ